MSKSWHSSWREWLVPGVLLALPLLSAEAWGGGKYTTPDNRALIADSNYMARVFHAKTAKTGELWMNINFADQAQVQFVYNRLLASGNTPENSPYLFSRLERMIKKAKARQQGDVSTSNTTNTKKCGHIVELNKTKNLNNANFSSNPQVSCFSGADYTYADIQAIRSTESGLNQVLLEMNSGEEYGGGRNFTDIGVAPIVAMDQGYKLTLDSMVMAFDDSGEEFTSYSLQATAVNTTTFTLVSDHPKDILVRPNEPTRICSERGTITGSLDCDYASVVPSGANLVPYGSGGGTAPTGIAAVKTPIINNSWYGDVNQYWKPTDANGAPTAYNTTKLYAPLTGSITANEPDCKITGFGDKTRAVLIVKQAGGTCTKYVNNQEIDDGGNFRAELRKRVVTPVNSFNYSVLGDFGTDCLAYLTDQQGSYWQDVELKFILYPIVQCGGVTAPTKQLYKTERFGKIIDYRNSCLAEGTSILKQDGTEAPIETIKLGDKILANADGLVLTVTGISRGRESKKMVRLSDDQGRQVLTTTKHPLLLADGSVKVAEQVKAGEQVKGRGGNVTIRSVERVPYEGQVYNLALGTSEELAKLSETDRTLFANGFLVGDSKMQEEMEVRLSAQAIPAQGDILARLPKALHQDYKNDLARKAAQQK